MVGIDKMKVGDRVLIVAYYINGQKATSFLNLVGKQGTVKKIQHQKNDKWNRDISVWIPCYNTSFCFSRNELKVLEKKWL